MQDSDASDHTPHRANGRTQPAWLDGQTAVVIGTIITVGIAVSGLILATNAATRQEIQRVHAETENVRRDMSSAINGLRTELSEKIDDVRKELLVEIKAVDSRLRAVELDVVAIRTESGLASSRDTEGPSTNHTKKAPERVHPADS